MTIYGFLRDIDNQKESFSLQTENDLPINQVGTGISDRVQGSSAAAADVKENPSANDSNMIVFDSGQSITFDDAVYHTAVTGTTGSGKTTSFIQPAIKRLIQVGFAGLVIDVKGNMTEKVKALAYLCGRQDDVLELGTGPDAESLNILSGMNEMQINDFYEKISFRKLTESHNMSFYRAGIRMTVDLTMLCRYLSIVNPDLTPTLVLISFLLDDGPLSSKLLELFKKIANDSSRKAFVKSIETNVFHICNWEKNIKDKKFQEDYQQQVEWAIRLTRTSLKNFQIAPGVEKGFCSSDGVPLDLERWIYDQKKIVILRFDPHSGMTGENLSRYCLESFYQAVYRRGLALPSGEKTFLVADEFQDIACFDSANTYNDKSFTAKSREFNNIFIIGTQSFSALKQQGWGMDAIEAFVNNINNRIMFYSDDPWTQQIANRHKDFHLTRLRPAEVMYIKFNNSKRNHESGLATLQKSYDSGQEWLRAGMAMMAGSNNEKIPYSPITGECVWGIVKKLEKTLEAAKRFVKYEDRLKSYVRDLRSAKRHFSNLNLSPLQSLKEMGKMISDSEDETSKFKGIVSMLEGKEENN